MDTLIQSNRSEQPAFFDPAEAIESSDDSSSKLEQTPEGPNMFKQRAKEAASKKKSKARKRIDVISEPIPEHQKIGRTRSQTNSLSSTDLVFEEGQHIMANKGRKVPFWFPGKIVEILSKGYKVEFLEVFGSEDCRKENVISVAEFETKRLTEGKTKLFKVPEKYQQIFADSLKKVLQ